MAGVEDGLQALEVREGQAERRVVDREGEGCALVGRVLMSATMAWTSHRALWPCKTC